MTNINWVVIEVAEIYQAVLARGEPPTLAVTKHFEVTRCAGLLLLGAREVLTCEQIVDLGEHFLQPHHVWVAGSAGARAGHWGEWSGRALV
jgi:hypothetical protein